MGGSLGPLEVIIIFLVILLIFGAKRIPEIARGLGKGIKEFKSATSEISKELTVDDTRPRVQQPHQSAPVSYAPPVQQQVQTPPPAAPPQQAPQPDNAGGPPTQ